ncbi:imelysin family protein [Sessilibacter sp. MAH4]
MRNMLVGLSLISLVSVSAATEAVTEKDVVNGYADLAHTIYEDTLLTAQQLQNSIETFLADPSHDKLVAAQKAWIAARRPYQQSEAFRFGHSIVDEKDLRLNSWPLDEGFIDYVDDSYLGELGNSGATANIIASKSLTLGAKEYDLSVLSPELLEQLNEFGGSEANVATGYHAIEFLLWGQDLYGTELGAGERPYTDFIIGDACTNGNCDRRRDYLLAATKLLVSDIAYLEAQWAPKQDNYRAAFVSLSTNEALSRILFGMGSLAFGELAGDRMRVALEANSPEDENDCFSDNTHNGYFDNAKAIVNVYTGEYQRSTGQLFSTDSLAELVAQKNPDLAQKMQHQLADTQAKFQAMVNAAEDKTSPMKFDQMIAEGNDRGVALINNAIASLAQETALIEQVAATLGIDNLNPDLAAE